MNKHGYKDNDENQEEEEEIEKQLLPMPPPNTQNKIYSIISLLLKVSYWALDAPLWGVWVVLIEPTVGNTCVITEIFKYILWALSAF